MVNHYNLALNPSKMCVLRKWNSHYSQKYNTEVATQYVLCDKVLCY